jgi:superfamily II DNA/RNA helicase
MDIRKRQPEFADIELSPPVKNALASIGIEKLYSHQASAIEKILAKSEGNCPLYRSH